VARLLQLLPPYGAGQLLRRGTTDLDWLIGAGGGKEFALMLERLDRPTSAFASASAGGETLKVFDMEVDGIEPAMLAEAYITAVETTFPSTTLGPRTIAGFAVQRLSVTDQGSASDVYAFVANDVVYVVFANERDRTGVDRMLEWMARPKLEAMFPGTVVGRPLIAFGAPAAAAPSEGTRCAILCPGEAQRFAMEAGVEIDAVDLAFATTPTDPAIDLIAFRVIEDGAGDLVAARIRADDADAASTTVRTTGGRSITTVMNPRAGSRGSIELLHQRGPVLFIVRAADTHSVGTKESEAATKEIVEALP
jgi:hypothetical protein